MLGVKYAPEEFLDYLASILEDNVSADRDYGIDCLIQWAATDLDAADLKRLIMRVEKNGSSDGWQQISHWLRIIERFVSNRLEDSDRKAAESVVWLIKRAPELSNLGMPYCFDFEMNERLKISSAWVASLISQEDRRLRILQNALELFVDHPSFQSELKVVENEVRRSNSFKSELKNILDRKR